MLLIITESDWENGITTVRKPRRLKPDLVCQYAQNFQRIGTPTKSIRGGYIEERRSSRVCIFGLTAVPLRKIFNLKLLKLNFLHLPAIKTIDDAQKYLIYESSNCTGAPKSGLHYASTCLVVKLKLLLIPKTITAPTALKTIKSIWNLLEKLKMMENLYIWLQFHLQH